MPTSSEPRTQPAEAPASILPDHGVQTRFLLLANPYAEHFELHCMAGPTGTNGNVRAEIKLTADQARRLATQILHDLDGWDEKVAKIQGAMSGPPS